MLTLFYSSNQNLRFPVHHYNSEIWSDKAGYYIYLPYIFQYGGNGKNAPAKLDSLCGDGFEFKENREVIFTKYPVGVAIMELPFYGLARIFEKIIKPPGLPGFTKINVFFRIFSVLFYLFWGLYLLGIIIQKHIPKFGYLILFFLSLLYATNTGYFSIWQPAMSHLYSFFLISALIYFFEKTTLKFSEFLLLSIIIGLIFSVRNINILFCVPIFIYYYKKILTFIKQFKWKITIGIFAGFVIVLPWIAYQLFMAKHHLAAYEGEGFIFWKSPKIIELFLSSTNGILIYTPWLVLILGIFIYYTIKKSKSAITALSVFLIVLITYASWWCYTLGCGLGHRGFIEFIPLFGFILMKNLNTKQFKLLMKLSIPFILYTGYLSYKIPACFDFAKNGWDYSVYWKLFEM